MLLISLLLIIPMAMAQGQVVSGTVTDDTGDPLPGVNITVKGTATGTITDPDGKFSLSVEPNAVLVFSFVGMETQEITYTGQASINVTMAPLAVGLDELVVIGYGTQSRRTITTAITKVDADKLEEVPVTSVATALQGKLSGVRIYQSSGGQPGGDATIRIRGGSSINKSNAPLVIIDGVVRDLDDINPADIENVQVLKDASSTAIYGARASNGVVLVTTKRGKLGKAEINFSTNTGYATPWKYMDMVDAEDFIYLSREAANRSPFQKDLNKPLSWGTGNDENSPWSLRYLGDGEEVPDGYKSMPDPVDPSKTLIFQDNDFQDITLNPGLEQNYSLSANGGTEKIKYAASIGYSDIEGMSVGTYFNRFNGRANVDFLLRENLTLTTRMDHSTSKTNNYGNQRDIFARSIWLAPTARVTFADGTYAPGENTTFTNPLFYNDVRKRDIYLYRTGVGANLAWDILPGLKAEVSGDYFIRNRTFESFEKANYYRSNRTAVFEYSQTKQYQFEGVVTYDRSFADAHNLNIVAGISQLYIEDMDSRAEAEGASTDLVQTLNAAPLKLDASSYRTSEALVGMFGRITYDFKKKYLLGVSLRRDGSSRFARENRYGIFPGASVGWIITEEDFMQGLPVLNTLKLRASMGQTGNNLVGRYAYAGEYQVGNNYYGMAGVLATEMPNRSLRWETTTQWDVGFDLGLFRGDRIRALFDYYEKVTTDLLFNVPLPNESGYNNIDQNVGKVKFWGYEFEIQADILKKGKFYWSADFNIGYNMNRVLELPDNGIDKNRIGGIYDPNTMKGVGGIAEGERMYSVLGQVTDFIIDNWEQANNAYFDASARGWSPLDGQKVKGRKIPGDWEYVDQNGDGVIDEYDKVVLGYLVPTTVGGFSTRFGYGNLELHVFMDYALGHSIADATLRRSYGLVVGGNYTPLADLLTEAWREEGDIASGKATMPRVDMQDQKQQKNYQRTTDKSVYKGDYLAVREVRLSYNAPKAWTDALRLGSMRFTLSGQNLHYFTAYPGWQTEYSSDANYNDNTYPIPRKIMLGIKIGF